METDDDIYGVDYSTEGNVTATGDMALVSGLANARQSIINQLLTEKGTYPSIDDEYGSEIYEILGEDFEDSSLQALEVYIANALYENPRVLELGRIEPQININNELIIILEITLVNGTEETLNINFGGISENG